MCEPRSSANAARTAILGRGIQHHALSGLISRGNTTPLLPLTLQDMRTRQPINSFAKFCIAAGKRISTVRGLCKDSAALDTNCRSSLLSKDRNIFPSSSSAWWVVFKPCGCYG